MNNLAEAIARDLRLRFSVLRSFSRESLVSTIEKTMKRELELSDPLVDTAFGVIAGGKRDGI